ncbi:type 4b pilus protein PilO2 (plasmid) [Methylocaldum gracile subsp. desertum]|uniref:type 4b pilus protein PilO2 n=1 Tax=Methylocaldum sp. GT1BW TaxID=3438964 RepID=UPI003DA02FD5
MAIRIINIGGQRLVTGLYWQNLSDTAHPRREIVQAGREADADMVCVPTIKNPIQAGYASRAELGSVNGARSLAGGLAESHTGSWLGLFKVPDDSDQYYYIAIQNDHILASSDVVGDLDEIRTNFEQTLSFGGWQYVTVPEGFNYPGVTVTHLTLAEMLTKRAPKLKPLEFKLKDLPTRKILYGVGAAAFLTLAAVAYSWWQQEEEKKRQEEIRRVLRDQEHARKAALDKALAAPPWNSAVPVERFLESCVNQWRRVRYSVGGWQLTGWNCESHQIIASYDKSSMASALQLMRYVPGASLSGDGRKAVIVTPIKMAATGSRPAVRGITAKAALMDYAESHVLTAAFQALPPPQALPGAEAPPPPPWTVEKVSIESAYPVFGLGKMAHVPGFVIKSLSSNPGNGGWKWQIEGELYVAK